MSFHQLNYEVMQDTQHQYETVPELKAAVEDSISRQYMVPQEENIKQPIASDSQTNYLVTGNRCFEAARQHLGTKTAVLNFANNHSVGGAPYSAGAQEESLCRCSTLLPCLQAMRVPFYIKHTMLHSRGKLNFMGNDDLIYTPDVVVFKSDKRTMPIHPQMMDKKEWYKVDVITSAAPELYKAKELPANYEEAITSRIKKILDVAAKENIETLILGAWGCGAYENPIEVIAKVFVKLLKHYNFKTVEFALATNQNVEETFFGKTFLNLLKE